MTRKLIPLFLFALAIQISAVARAEEDPELHAVAVAQKLNETVKTDVAAPTTTCDLRDATPDQERGFISLPSTFLLEKGRPVTQVLYGEEIKILERKGGYVRVAAVNQKTAQYPDGYQGWVLESAISKNTQFLSQVKLGNNIATTGKETLLYSDPECKKPLLRLSFGSKLPSAGATSTDEKTPYKVMTPSGSIAYLKKNDAIEANKEAYSPQAVVKIAQQFIGLKYVWGGTSSSQGMDCSGLIYRIYSAHGVAIPRNAKDQFEQGQVIPRDKLQPGDLVFFSEGKGTGLIHHVGVYIGNGQMIHSPRTGSHIMISRMDVGEFDTTYAGARRYNQ